MRRPAFLAAFTLALFSAPCRAGADRFAVIVHSADLGDAAAAWRDYRVAQGWVIELAPATHESTAESVRTRIRELVTAHVVGADDKATATTAVLLLGDVGTDRIPTFYFPQNDPALSRGGVGQFASDHPYALLKDGDERETIAVGRVPVVTRDEAMVVLEKIKRYEHDAPVGAWRHRINYVAGEGHFGGFDALLETLFIGYVDQYVPDSFDMTMTYAKADSRWCPPPSRLERTALERLSEGALLFNYVGHGHAQGLDSLRWGSPTGSKRTQILRAEALKDLPECGTRNPIALMTCCSTGWFDLDAGRDCIGETMLKHAQGPIAVIAGTRPTHPYGNTLFQKDFTRALITHADLPLGEIDRLTRRDVLASDAIDLQIELIARPIAALTKWKSSLEELRLMHVRMYALLGDPMLRLASPGAAIDEFRVIDGALHGRVANMTSGCVEVVIETPRAECAAAAELKTATPDDDLEARAALNYPRANDRVIWRDTVELRAGGFSLALPSPLPERAHLIRAFAVGVGANGAAIEAIGGVRLKRTELANAQTGSAPASR